jgi:hypothetical protein
MLSSISNRAYFMTDTKEGGNVRWRVRIYFSGVCSERYDGHGWAALQENAFMPRS